VSPRTTLLGNNLTTFFPWPVSPPAIGKTLIVRLPWFVSPRTTLLSTGSWRHEPRRPETHNTAHFLYCSVIVPTDNCALSLALDTLYNHILPGKLTPTLPLLTVTFAITFVVLFPPWSVSSPTMLMMYEESRHFLLPFPLAGVPTDHREQAKYFIAL